MSHFLARRSGAPGNDCDHRLVMPAAYSAALSSIDPADLAYQYD